MKLSETFAIVAVLFFNFTLASNPTSSPTLGPTYCSILKKPLFEKHNCDPDIPTTFLKDVGPDTSEAPVAVNVSTLGEAFKSLVILQSQFWSHHRGTWPRAIDWTAAFIHTSLCGMADTLSRALMEAPTGDADRSMVWNMVNTYFSQVVGFYFGQNDKSLQRQAYDDMLWVVLGWLESTNLITSHSSLHYPRAGTWDSGAHTGLEDALTNQPWHGNQWTEAFAHRARTFWELASNGWTEDLCGGGMEWNPRLLVYKNAVTNQLWIAASAKMYLDFPGDAISSRGALPVDTLGDGPPMESRNITFLEAALKGYDWLMSSNMTNNQGLFADGYHVSRRTPNNTRCDEREENVYTYNQGVLLTGQRALWEATGVADFLRDGHRLIQNVIAATGWDPSTGGPSDDVRPDKLPPWRGLGRGGVIEDACDAMGKCSQNGQTFKGIYFHHLRYFCRPIAKSFGGEEGSLRVDGGDFEAVVAAHGRACRRYIPWVAYNARAALETRDETGVFGMWWGAEKFAQAPEALDAQNGSAVEGQGVDYRNFGLPQDDVWARRDADMEPLPGINTVEGGTGSTLAQERQDGSNMATNPSARQQRLSRVWPGKARNDPNKRGRGRTVETQNSGMEVVQAWWELSRAYGEVDEAQRLRARAARWMFTYLWRVWEVAVFLFHH